MSAPPQRSAKVTVYLPDYSGKVGTIPDYLSASATWQYLGVGTGALTVTERGGPALQLMQARDLVVPVTIQLPGYPRWSGRVQHFEASRDTGQAGRITATLTDDTQWLKKILAAPVPGAPWSNQIAAAYDARSGPLVTVAKAYIAANLSRLAAEGRPTPLVVAPTIGGDTSPAVSLQARNDPLQSVLVDALREAGYDLTATLWLPGDYPVPGLTLTAPAIVVDVAAGRDRHYVNFTDTSGGVTGRTIAGTHPQALGVLVMGPGELTDRTFLRVTADDGRVEALGKWGFPEDTLEATDVDASNTDLLISRGRDKLAELGGTAAITLKLDDRRPWQFGPDRDVWVADLARATFSGVQVADRIDSVTVTDNSDGQTVTPAFGASRDTETPDVQLARTLVQVRQQLAAMQARK